MNTIENETFPYLILSANCNFLQNVCLVTGHILCMYIFVNGQLTLPADMPIHMVLFFTNNCIGSKTSD